jgi:hypothetical protein
LAVLLGEEFRGGEHKSIVTIILIAINVVAYLYTDFSSSLPLLKSSDESILGKRVKSTGENPSEYQWFLDIVSKGYVKPACGWGLGLERLVKAFHGLARVGFATSHPRLPGVIGP